MEYLPNLNILQEYFILKSYFGLYALVNIESSFNYFMISYIPGNYSEDNTTGPIAIENCWTKNKQQVKPGAILLPWLRYFHNLVIHKRDHKKYNKTCILLKIRLRCFIKSMPNCPLEIIYKKPWPALTTMFLITRNVWIDIISH